MTIAELERRLRSARDGRARVDCQTFQQLLENDLQDLDDLQAAEQEWQHALHAGQIDFDMASDRHITRLYRDWVRKARLRLGQLELQRARKCFPGAAVAFRRRFREARAALAERLRDERVAAERATMAHGDEGDG